MSLEALEGRTPEPEGVFHADGTINEAFITENYGLGIEEASQEIKFGTHTGTMAQMLADEDCPVSGRLKKAYQEKGIDGVIEFFEGAKMMDPDFSVVISEDTITRERAKQPETIPEEPAAEQETAKKDSPQPPENPTPTHHTRPDRKAIEERVAVERHEAELDVPPTDSDEEIEDLAPADPTPSEHDDEIVADETPPVEEVISAAKPIQPENPTVIMNSIPTPAPTDKKDQVVTRVAIQAKPTANLVNVSELVEPIEATEPIPLEACTHVEAELGSPIDIDLDAPDLVEMTGDEMSEVQEFIVSLQLIDAGMINETEIMAPAAVELAQQVGEALSAPEVMESEAVQEAVTNVVEAATIIRLLEEAGEDVSEAEQQLVLACQALLDELGISYEQEAVEQFAKLVLAAQIAESKTKAEATANLMSEDEGTHEFKPSDLVDVPGLLLRAKQTFMPLRELGKHALEGSLATV